MRNKFIKIYRKLSLYLVVILLHPNEGSQSTSRSMFNLTASGSLLFFLKSALLLLLNDYCGLATGFSECLIFL